MREGLDRSVSRIVVCNLDSLYSGAGLHILAEAMRGKIVGICSSKRYGRKYGSFISQFRSNLSRSGLGFVTYLSLHMLYYVPMAYLASAYRRLLGQRPKVYTLTQLARAYGIPIVHTNEPNDPAIVKWIRDLKPDLIVSAYFDHVIRRDLINTPALGVINVHTAHLPDFRGPFPTLWPEVQGRDPGVTIHYINSEALDAGPILMQKTMRRHEGESILGLDCRLYREAMHMVLEVIDQIERGTVRAVAQDTGKGTYYSYPTRADLSALARRGVALYSARDFLKQF